MNSYPMILFKLLKAIALRYTLKVYVSAMVAETAVSTITLRSAGSLSPESFID